MLTGGFQAVQFGRMTQGKMAFKPTLRWHLALAAEPKFVLPAAARIVKAGGK